MDMGDWQLAERIHAEEKMQARLNKAAFRRRVQAQRIERVGSYKFRIAAAAAVASWTWAALALMR